MRVIIESPHQGDVQRNTIYARRALMDSLQRGEAPIASHLLHTQVLDDTIPEHRRAGIAAGLAWIAVAELVVAYDDYGVSAGMKAALAEAKARRVTSVFRKIGLNPPEEEPHAFLASEPSFPRDLCVVCGYRREEGNHR